MALVGLLTMLSLFSNQEGGLTGYWVSALKSVFGWGVYILPAGLILLGAWLVARNVERLPVLSIERIVGILLLFVGLLAAFHSLSGSAATALERAQTGTGGGYIGALIQQGLVRALGDAGMFIIITAWLLIALAMTLDLSLQEMFQWAIPLAARIKTRFSQFYKRTTPAGGDGMPDQPESPPDDFTMLARPPADQPASAQGPLVKVRTNLPATPAHIYMLPRVSDILEPPQAPVINAEFVERRARLIEETLASFGAPARVVDKSMARRSPCSAWNRSSSRAAAGARACASPRSSALADDLALALAAPRIRIQAPVPGRSYVGIEVPNEEISLVALREVMESESLHPQQVAAALCTRQGCGRASQGLRPGLHAAPADRRDDRFR